MDNQYIRGLKIQKKSVIKRLYAAVCLLLVASLLISTATYAWLVLSQAPEVTGMTSNIGANGNLEIALGKNIGESAVGDSFNKNKVTQTNRTWGNLVDLSDTSYGLQEITLRPAILNAAGGAVNTLHPLAYPIYREDGRVERIYANNVFAGTYNGSWFTSSANEYGVRGIGAANYVAPGTEDTFGPLSQRQELYYRAYNDLWQMTASSYTSLCQKSQKVLMAYCYDGTGISAADFNLDVFAKNVDEVIAAANEELRLSFTLLAAAEMTPPENYHAAIDHLEETYPNYEAVRSLVGSTIQSMGAADVGAAIAELRAFQDAAAQLKSVIASGEINGSDGYSMEEIAQTVGLIFDLEKTSFSMDTVIKNETTYDYILNKFYSKIVSELYYQARYYERYEGYSKLWTNDSCSGSSVCTLTSSLNGQSLQDQDNASREGIASYIINSPMYLISTSLRLADLDQAIGGLYVSHWNYWDEHAEEYQRLQDETAELEAQVKSLEESIAEQKEQADVTQNEISALEAELQLKTAQLAEKNTQLQTLLKEKVYAPDDSHLETIRSVMEDTIEAMRKYTLWSIAYFACDGQVPDDAYHRMQEIASSSENMHPRTAYRTLCNYGVTPAYELTQMLEAYEKLEKELLLWSEESGGAEPIMWSEVDAELRRVFGPIAIRFYFSEYYTTDNYISSYFPEDTVAPTEVMKKIREEIDAYKTGTAASSIKQATFRISYDSYANEAYQLWAQALGLLDTFYDTRYPFDYGDSEYTLENLQFTMEHDVIYTNGFPFGVSVGVGSEDNFNESGLTVRQTRFQKAQESISYYQNQLITSAVNVDKDLVDLLMQIIAGQSSVSLVSISDYLTGLQQKLEYGEAMMYQAALAMAASNYADDTAYMYVYSDSAPKDAAGLIALLQDKNFDEKVLTAFDHRMKLLDEQKALLQQSVTLLKSYQHPQTGDLTAERIPTAEAAALLNPVLDTTGMTLYGYAEEERDENSDETVPPSYSRTVLYRGFGSPAVQINGRQATVGDGEPFAIFGEVYLSLGRSLSGSLLAFAKTQVETYTPPSGSLSAENIVSAELGMNRQAYAIGAGEDMFTLNLCTVDTPYALATNLWTYTGNTEYISANNILIDIYGYCIDLSFRTNAANSDLLLQTEAINRINNDGETLADTSMGAGSYMEFTIDHPSYTLDLAKEYMSCLRVAITDTRTGYIYGYAALDMDEAEVVGVTIKAPLRLYNKATGIMLEGEAAQYICHLDQNLEKNISVYVYLDGAKTSNILVSAYDEQSLHGALNLQFCSSANLIPADIGVSENSSNRLSETSDP